MSQNDHGEPFVMFDQVLEHKGDKRYWEDWDFQTGLKAEPGVPLNWLAPVNYAEGRYHARLEVLDMKETDQHVGFGFGWMNFPLEKDPTVQHRCGWPVRFRMPGVYAGTESVARMWHGPGEEKDPTLPWDWTHAYDRMMTLLQPRGQDPFPVTYRLTLAIIPKGMAFPPRLSDADVR